MPPWMAAPKDELPGIVPVELVLGRSENTVVMLGGLRVFSTGLEMRLSVLLRGPVGHFDLNGEVFDGPYRHDMSPEWQADRLKWGFEFADGRRVTSVDGSAWEEATRPGEQPEPGFQPGGWSHEPTHPVLQGGGGGSSAREAYRDNWLWPLPPPGPLVVVCQWLARDIAQTRQEIDGAALAEAAARARPIW